MLWVWGGFLYRRGRDLGGYLIPFLYQACIEWYSHIFACGGACIEDGGEPHGWAFAGSFPVACGHSVQLYACHIGMCETSQGQSTLTDTLSVSITSLNVSKGFTCEGNRVAALYEGDT